MTLAIGRGSSKPLSGSSSTTTLLSLGTPAPRVTCKPPLPRIRPIRSRRITPSSGVKSHDNRKQVSPDTCTPYASNCEQTATSGEDSRGGSSMSSYSSSSLDDPIPQWTAYTPKKGVAWAPCRTHSWTEQSENRHRTLSLSNLGGSLTSLVESLASALGTPRLSRSKKIKPPADTTTITTTTTITQTPVKTISHSYSTGNLCENLTLSKGSLHRSRVDISPITIVDLDVLKCDSPDSGISRLTDNGDSDQIALISPEIDSNSVTSSNGLRATNVMTSCCSVPIRTMQIPDFSINHKNQQVETNYTAVLLNRRCLKTGSLLYRENHITICRGSLRSKRNQYPSYTRPVTIQIYTGVNTSDARSRLLQSIQTVRQLHHPFIHTVWGACVEGCPNTPDGVEILVATGCTHFHVTLHRMLRWTKENNPQLLTERCITTIGTQLCKGLQYLQDQSIVHTNLKATTILLDPSCTAKVSVLEENHLSRDIRHRWMAIETLHKNVSTCKSTLWSLGVIIWELVTLGSMPYPHLENIHDVCVYLAKGKRLIRPDNCSKHLYQIMLECWRTKPRDRPSYAQLEAMLMVYSQTLPASKPVNELYPNTYEYWEEDMFTNEDEYSEDEYI